MKIFRNTTVLFLALWVSACTVVVREDMIITPSVDIDGANLRILNTAYESIEIDASDESKIFALHKNDSTIGTTIVVFHGNALNLTLQPWFGMLDTLGKLDVNVLAIDYRGFGKSEGEANFTHMKEDAISTMNYLPNNQNIFVYGLSLGSVMAAEVMNDRRVKGVIIEGGITNETEMVEWFRSRNSLGSLAKVELDANLVFDIPKLVESFQKPILVIHGDEDDNIPLDMGKTIFNSTTNEESVLFIVEGGGHCDSFAIDEEKYLGAITAFLAIEKP